MVGTSHRIVLGNRGMCILTLCLGLIMMAFPISDEDDLLEMSLENLMNVEVAAVSKKAESRFGAAAAVTVISSEDICCGGDFPMTVVVSAFWSEYEGVSAVATHGAVPVCTAGLHQLVGRGSERC